VQLALQRRVAHGPLGPRPGCGRLGHQTGSLQQVGVRRVQRRVPGQRAGGEYRFQDRQPGVRAVGHADRHGPVDLHHRGRGKPGQRAVQRRDLRPVGRLETVRRSVQRRDRRLDLVGPRPAPGHRGVQYRGAVGDQRRIPAGPVLVREQHRPAVGILPRRRPGVVQQHQRDQAGGLGVLRQQPMQQPAQPDRLLAQVRVDQLFAAAGRVTLVEHQVDDRVHAVEPPGQGVGARHLEPDPRLGDLPLGPHQPLRESRLGQHEPGGDLPRGQPCDEPERQRDPDLEREGRMAAGEHEPELVIAAHRHGRSIAGGGSVGVRELLRVDRDRPVAPELVDRLPPRGRHEPAARVGRRAVPRPHPRRGRERLGRGVLGRLQVTEPAGQGGDHRGPLVPVGMLKDARDRIPIRAHEP
jgi:hypothetical protein